MLSKWISKYDPNGERLTFIYLIPNTEQYNPKAEPCKMDNFILCLQKYLISKDKD